MSRWPVLAVVAVGGLAAVAAGGAAQATNTRACAPAWRVLTSVSDRHFGAVAIARPGVAWVGGWEEQTGSHRPLVSRWSGDRVTDIARPPFDREVRGLATSGRTLWAVEADYGQGGGTSLARWNGAWTGVGVRGAVVTALAKVETRVLAAGRRGRLVVLFRLDGARANELASLALPSASFRIDGLDGSASNDVWLVGHRSEERDSMRIVLHWDGRRLSRVRLTPLGLNSDERFLSSLDTVAVRTRSDGWAFGYNLGDDNLLAERWDGSRWRVFPRRRLPSLPRRAGIQAAANDPHGLIWAVGGLTLGVAVPPSGPLVMRWDGRRWARLRVPAFKGNLAAVAAGAGEVWAVGGDDVAPHLGEAGSGVVLRRSCN